MKYPYFRGLEADRYSFYRVPKALIKVDLFEKMSGDAKLLYAVLLDRMNLSLKNGWQDEDGNAYIICTIDEIMDSIRCARQKAVKLLDELEHEYQLIERRNDDSHTHIEIILFKQRHNAQHKEHKGCKAQDTGREPAHCTAEPNQHRQNKYNREQ